VYLKVSCVKYDDVSIKITKTIPVSFEIMDNVLYNESRIQQKTVTVLTNNRYKKTV